jgi:hypothetical protein
MVAPVITQHAAGRFLELFTLQRLLSLEVNPHFMRKPTYYQRQGKAQEDRHGNSDSEYH